MKRTVGPIGRGIFRSENKNDFLLARMKRHDPTMRSVACLIEISHLAAFNIHHANKIAVETIPHRIIAGVIDNPFPVGRPHASIGDDSRARPVGDLSFVGHRIGGRRSGGLASGLADGDAHEKN